MPTNFFLSSVVQMHTTLCYWWLDRINSHTLFWQGAHKYHTTNYRKHQVWSLTYYETWKFTHTHTYVHIYIYIFIGSHLVEFITEMKQTFEQKHINNHGQTSLRECCPMFQYPNQANQNELLCPAWILDFHSPVIWELLPLSIMGCHSAVMFKGFEGFLIEPPWCRKAPR